MVLAVSVDPNRPQTAGAVKALHLTMPVLMFKTSQAASAALRPFSVQGIPRTLVIDRKGMIRADVIGGDMRQVAAGLKAAGVKA